MSNLGIGTDAGCSTFFFGTGLAGGVVSPVFFALLDLFVDSSPGFCGGGCCVVCALATAVNIETITTRMKQLSMVPPMRPIVTRRRKLFGFQVLALWPWLQLMEFDSVRRMK